MGVLKKIFNSYKAIIVALSLLVVTLLVFNIYLIKSTKVYSFSGGSDDFTILTGSIYIGHNINRFQAPHIIYNGVDLTLKNGKIGYYIGDREISSIKINEELKLKDIINSYDFSFTEMNKKAQKLNKSNIEDIDSLTFKVVGEAKDSAKIAIEIPLNVTYLGK